MENNSFDQYFHGNRHTELNTLLNVLLPFELYQKVCNFLNYKPTQELLHCILLVYYQYNLIMDL